MAGHLRPQFSYSYGYGTCGYGTCGYGIGSLATMRLRLHGKKGPCGRTLVIVRGQFSYKSVFRERMFYWEGNCSGKFPCDSESAI